MLSATKPNIHVPMQQNLKWTRQNKTSDAYEFWYAFQFVPYNVGPPFQILHLSEVLLFVRDRAGSASE